MDVSACRTRFCLYLGILVFCAGVIRGNAQTEPSSITPVFRASTHLVVLDVVVTDKAGKPIPELRKEDFSVKESGKAQAISFLNQPKTETAATVPALPRNTYSNAAEYRLAGLLQPSLFWMQPTLRSPTRSMRGGRCCNISRSSISPDNALQSSR